MTSDGLSCETIITLIEYSMDKKRNFMANFKFWQYYDLRKSGIL